MDKIVSRSRWSWRRPFMWSLLSLLVIVIGVLTASWVWYAQQLAPVKSTAVDKVAFIVKAQSAPSTIGRDLEDKGLIRSHLAFSIHTRLTGTQSKLQAGTYMLTPSDSTQEIVSQLVSGEVTTMSVILYPGATLVDATKKATSAKHDVTTSLQAAGFSSKEITEGLAADYSSYNMTLFQGRPASADLEGYVYGDTYSLRAGASVEEVLRMSFDEFWSVIQENDLVSRFDEQGLTLFEGITLASIVQREAIGGDEASIAQVFHTRLGIDMPLGSDVTYQYIADKTGVARDPMLNSPYNTRRFTGLTPGPIAAPGLAALKAVASPAATNYLYFLSGDDDVTYFARTISEHEANIRDHCQEKCQIL